MPLTDDSDGMHKCDHTGAVDGQQLDKGVDHTFVSAPAGVRRSARLFFLSSGEPVPKCNSHAPTRDVKKILGENTVRVIREVTGQ